MSPHKTRPPSQAGRFYDADPQRLRNEVSTYIDEAPNLLEKAIPTGFVAPHAGYTFSGPTAGHTWRQIHEVSPSRVFVLAPSHHAAFPLCSIWDGDAYETPLGICPIDRRTADAVIQRLPGIECHHRAEQAEHALEVQVPFLQIACPDAQLIPVLVGTQSPSDTHRIAGAIALACGDTDCFDPGKVAFVASSDTYHGYSLEECRESDEQLARDLSAMDADALYADAASRRAQACGLGPIAIVMELARRLGATRGRTLQHTTSADALPGRAPGDYVVGYLSVLFD